MTKGALLLTEHNSLINLIVAALQLAVAARASTSEAIVIALAVVVARASIKQELIIAECHYLPAQKIVCRSLRRFLAWRKKKWKEEE